MLKKNTQPDTSWTIQGNVYNPINPMTQPSLKAITIPEVGTCVSMPGCSHPFGRPIDANLAINFIANFNKTFTITNGDDPATFEQVLNTLPLDGLKAIIKKSQQLHESVVKLNYGMTLDKNMALKILSQPRCEGIRFYLCSESGADSHISLVLVGVDEKGYDLNYKSPRITFGTQDAGALLPRQGDVPAIKTVTMESLSGEYVTPPYDAVADGTHTPELEASFYERFVLLNIANGKIKVPASERPVTPAPGPPAPDADK
jgi:hypothetical protein